MARLLFSNGHETVFALMQIPSKTTDLKTGHTGKSFC